MDSGGEQAQTFLSVVGPPETIYHYTDQEALISIIRTNTLRFTDIKCLNDSTDGSYLVELHRAAVAALKSEGTWSPVQRQAFDFVVERMKKARDIFVACFSSRENLNQWAHYTSSRQGYAIGFDSRELALAVGKIVRANQDTFWAGHVEYTDNSQEILNAVRDIGSKAPALPIDTEAQRTHLFNQMIQTLDRFEELMTKAEIARYKHPAFRDERESRIAILRRHPELPSKDGAPGLSFEFMSGKSFIRPTHTVHLGQNGLVGLVREVWVGPGPQIDIAASKLQMLLESSGYSERLRSKALKIYESKVPFRYW